MLCGTRCESIPACRGVGRADHPVGGAWPPAAYARSDKIGPFSFGKRNVDTVMAG
jgi:hypothetical protein